MTDDCAAGRLRAPRIGLWTGALDSLPLGVLTDTVVALDQAGWGLPWFCEAYGRGRPTQALLLARSSSNLATARPGRRMSQDCVAR
ncbi:MAG: hypothetical protein NVS3B26_16230 [Mycobacteriales bacterium]